MHRAARVTCSLLLALLLAGCGKKPGAQTPANATTTPATGVPETPHPARPPAPGGDETRQPNEPPPKAVMTFADLKKAYIGKSRDEFRARFGKPESIQTDGADEYWYYKGLTVDPETKEVDEQDIQVSIRNGIIQRMNR